jgi:hypothetical protein
MANPIRINAATLNRPGVFVAQATSGSLPQPIATHAVGYIFGTTPAEDYYGKDAIDAYSYLEPYKPTQIASADDYLEKIGATGVPIGNKGALASYDSVKAFFDNVGVNGILYFTRVTPTPETVVDIGKSTAGTGYNAFAIKVNGRYFGTPIGIYDADNTEIKVITTTGLDQIDNARDVYTYLSGNGDGFADFYKIEQNAIEALAGKFRIFSKDSRRVPEIEEFHAYKFSNSEYAQKIDLLQETGVISFYTSVKEINFRCVSRDQATKEGILHLSGAQLSSFFAAQDTYNDIATQQSDILKAFLNDQKIYTTGNIPDDKYVAISKDLSTNTTKWADADAVYWQYDAGTNAFTKVVSGTDAIVPSGNPVTRQGYLPDSVQVFYLNVAGENRAIIVNGSTPEELTTGLVNEIKAVLTEKDLIDYYTVEAVSTETGKLSDTKYIPNNGLDTDSDLVSAVGNPYIRPELSEIFLSGTVGISGGVVTGTNTLFSTELANGGTFVANGVTFTIASISSNTQMTVTPNNVTIDPGAQITTTNKSSANGFYSHDYVLRVKITSKNGVSSPVYPGINRSGISDPNVVKLISTAQNAGYDSYKVSATAKANDFVYAIEQGVGSATLAPGFLFAPEAYSVLTYEAGTGDFASASEARQERLKITQTLVRAAEGKIGTTEGITSTQHVALIDCGADEVSLGDVQDELDLIKGTVGVPFGHAAYYAPYVKNLDDRYVAPSGYVAGIACSRYINEGFQQPPAGARYPLRGAVGLKFDISAQQQEVTYALGLNPIRSLPNRGIVTWGARTLSTNPLFKFINTRVILNVLVDVLGRSFDDILFEQIDSAGTVYARVKSIASQVCGQFFRQGALFGSRPEQAYLVVCSSANNDNTSLEQGTVRLDVYVATSPTLERLLVTVVRTPAGQVVQLSDSFSRNEERFSNLLNTTNVF